MKQQGIALIIVFLAVCAAAFVFATRPMPALRLLSQIGITLGVPANPYNTLNAQLDQKQAQIDQQAADLAAREAAFASSTETQSATASFPWYVVLGISALALLLVIFNFYFDWRREKREASHGTIEE